MNAFLFSLCQMCLIILALMFLLSKAKQPYMVAYMLAGVLLGPHILSTITHVDEIEAIGEVGILLLMFFLGMEINIPDSRSQLTRPLTMQLLKIVLSFLFAIFIGMLASWPVINIIVIALLFVFNSTAVVTEYLRKNGELSSPLGSSILNILVFQDILLAPAITLLQFVGNKKVTFLSLLLPVVISCLVILLFRFIRSRRRLFSILLHKDINWDHDLQVFAGLLICLGFGAAAELSGLSSALGSFIAGIVIGRIKAFSWLERSLQPFKIFFMALFFLSFGLRLDLPYVVDDWVNVLAGTFFILFSNSVLSALAFRILNYNWKESFYAGALLSQTGEFGVLILTIAYKTSMIDAAFFKTGVAITALALLTSTLWISVLRKYFYPRNQVV